MQIQILMQLVMDGLYLEDQLLGILCSKCTILQVAIQVQVLHQFQLNTQDYSAIVGFTHRALPKFFHIHQPHLKLEFKGDQIKISAVFTE